METLLFLQHHWIFFVLLRFSQHMMKFHFCSLQRVTVLILKFIINEFIWFFCNLALSRIKWNLRMWMVGILLLNTFHVLTLIWSWIVSLRFHIIWMETKTKSWLLSHRQLMCNFFGLLIKYFRFCYQFLLLIGFN